MVYCEDDLCAWPKGICLIILLEPNSRLIVERRMMTALVREISQCNCISNKEWISVKKPVILANLHKTQFALYTSKLTFLCVLYVNYSQTGIALLKYNLITSKQNSQGNALIIDMASSFDYVTTYLWIFTYLTC